MLIIYLLLCISVSIRGQTSYNIFFNNQINAVTNLTILHFNDEYLVEGGNTTVNGVSQPYGGAARLKTIVDRYPGAIVTFGGDMFFPSALSSIFNGAHMVDVFSRVGVTVAVPGNHEFDKGLPTAKNLFGNSTFPWIVSNLLDPTTNSTVLGLPPTLTLMRNGVKIGFIGLVSDWRDPVLNLGFLNMTETGRKYAKQLRSEGADIVIALTHADKTEDVALVKAVPEIDLVLGGHDHDLQNTNSIGGVIIYKAGSDLTQVGLITAKVGGGISQIRTADIALDKNVPENPAIKAVVESWKSKAKISAVKLGTLANELVVADVRLKETNAGDLMTDALVWEVKQRVPNLAGRQVVSFVNAGALRGSNIPAGDITTFDLLGLIPFDNIVYVLEVNGATLKAAVENGLKNLPAAAGRFLQISGFQIIYNPNAAAGSRVKRLINSTGSIIQDNDKFLLGTLAFLGTGGDEYTMLSPITPIIDARNGRDSRQVLAEYIQTFNTSINISLGRITTEAAVLSHLSQILSKYSPQEIHQAMFEFSKKNI